MGLLQVERHVRWVWRFLMMPLLFGLIGTSVNFSSLAKGTIPKSVGIVFAGEPMPTGLLRKLP